ncbi:hypothetical protein B566_EDAN006663 [Ephemera danica]|nr:hypothetical protein B566_EDAN006663 [Ephemera danica]
MSSGFTVPILVSAFIQDNESMASWRMVFLVSAVINVLGALIYVAFGSGEVQPWNDPPPRKSKEDKLLEMSNTAA